jgi:hypothetical protein
VRIELTYSPTSPLNVLLDRTLITHNTIGGTQLGMSSLLKQLNATGQMIVVVILRQKIALTIETTRFLMLNQMKKG